MLRRCTPRLPSLVFVVVLATLAAGCGSTNPPKTADTLASDLDGLDKPDTQVGQQAKDSLDQLSSDLNKAADSIKATVDGVSSLSDVPSAAATVRTTFGTMQSDVTSTVKSLEQLDAKGELRTSFQQSTACDRLSGSS